MKIALIGYGKMGKEIEKIALERGHDVVVKIDKDNYSDMDSSAFKSADVAIEFTTPETAFNNLSDCLKHGVPVVCGTTGWLARFEEIKKICTENNSAFFYTSNYSVGVNVFFHLNRELAKIMQRFDDYNLSMEEIHHIHKKDAPSGTAITLAEDIIKIINKKTEWVNEPSEKDNDVVISSVREGEVPGTHTVCYESKEDIISIRHEAKNRRGLALGAVIAAEFIKGKKGFFSMNDILGF